MKYLYPNKQYVFALVLYQELLIKSAINSLLLISPLFWPIIFMHGMTHKGI